MKSQLSYKATLFGKKFPTICTFIRLLPSVNSLVFINIRLTYEGLPKITIYNTFLQYEFSDVG